MAAATEHLNGAVVFGFKNKSTLQGCVLSGDVSPSVALGSFSSTGGSGFPFREDTCFDSGITTSGADGEFAMFHATGVSLSGNANPIFIGDLISTAAAFNLRGLASSVSGYYGEVYMGAGATLADGTFANAQGELYQNNVSIAGPITPTGHPSGNTVYLGGYSNTASRACYCDMTYAVYGTSIKTSRSAAVAAIHAAMTG